MNTNNNTAKTIEISPVTFRARKHRGQVWKQTTDGVWSAVVVAGKSIRISGTYTNHVNGVQTFDRTFGIGDEVEHSSYNLRYTGNIKAIAAGTVTVQDGNEVKRMELAEFIRRNWNFDAAKTAAFNAEEFRCI